jgi:glycosyltransferase involved in cell wall biosynthesis
MTRFLTPTPEGPIDPAEPPSFSIVIPAYEATATIAEAVESALAQALPAKEVVVCDDGSRDDLAAAIAPYRERVELVRQENRGAAAARNTAVEHASGEFVVNLDADDVLLPGSLAARAELLSERPDLDIVVTEAIVELDGVPLRSLYREDWTFETADQPRAILERCFIAPPWSLRRSRFLAVGGFDETLSHAEDWELFVRMIRSGSRAGLVDQALARYRLQRGSLSNQPVGLIRGRLEVFERSLRRDDLSDSERERVAVLRDEEERELKLTAVREALLERSPRARHESRRLAFDSSLPAGQRARGLLAWLAPALARRLLLRRGSQTAAGITIADG